MSYALPIVVAAVGLLLLVVLAVRAFVVLRRFGAVTTAVTGHIGDRAEVLGGRASRLGAELARRRGREDRTEIPSEPKTRGG